MSIWLGLRPSGHRGGSRRDSDASQLIPEEEDQDEEWFESGMEDKSVGPGEDIPVYSVCRTCEPIRFKPFVFEPLLPNRDNASVPVPRSGHRVVVTDHYLYAFGGFNPSVADDPRLASDPIWATTKPLFQELWRFSLLTRTWTKLSLQGRPPKELASHCTALWDETTLIVFGGSGMPFGHASSNKLYICDLKRGRWCKVDYENEADDPNIPEKGYGQALCLDQSNNCLYVCGGTNGFDYSLEMHRFDMETRIWRRLALTPAGPDVNSLEPRYRHEMVKRGDRIYVIAGGTSTESFSMENIPAFNLATNRWERVRTRAWKDEQGGEHYPTPRYSQAFDTLGEYCYIMGGANEREVMDDCWAFHVPTLTWSRLPCKLPATLYFHSAGITKAGQMLVFGGVNSLQIRNRSNAIFSAWFRVPSLFTLAKQAMMDVLRRNLDDFVRNGSRPAPHCHDPSREEEAMKKDAAARDEMDCGDSRDSGNGSVDNGGGGGGVAAMEGVIEAGAAADEPENQNPIIGLVNRLMEPTPAAADRSRRAEVDILSPRERCEHLSLRIIERNLRQLSINDRILDLPEV